jgi:hypothetical protein
MAGWVEQLEHKAAIVLDQMAAARALASRMDIDPEAVARPYFDMLNMLYADEMPHARALDSSDLVLRIEGPALQDPNPRIKLLSGIFADLREQVTKITKAMIGLSDTEPAKFPPEFELGLTSLARGSLVMGVKVRPPQAAAKGGERIDAVPGTQVNLWGEEDPLYQAVREAIRSLARVAWYIGPLGIDEDINDDFPDPGVRDVVLTAAEQLAPSGRRGYDRVTITADGVDKREPEPLTPQSRKVLRANANTPVRSTRLGDFIGRVRAIDLDARRFQLRRVEGAGAVRCVYSDVIHEPKALLDRTIQVSGLVEYDRRDRPRLMQVQSFSILEETMPAEQLRLAGY